MVEVVGTGRHGGPREILAAMHADRKSVFVDRLGWDVPVVDGCFEIDEFDDAHAVYLIATMPGTVLHLGSVRLLPTTRRHLLGDLFPILVDGEVPRGPDIFEITRLCTSPLLADRQAHKGIREHLAMALFEYALTTGIRAYTMTTHLACLPQLLATGWDVEPLGLPKTVGGESLGALQVNVNPETLQRFRARFALAEPVLRLGA